MQFEHRFAKLRSNISRLRAMDPFCKRFGSDAHRYRLGSRLHETALQNFEQWAGFALPPDFRAFVLQVGNGGAGPLYGWQPFGPYEAYYRRPEWRLPWRNTNDLSEDEEEVVSEQGVIELCHHGCGMHDFLVVNGDEAGTIWFSNGGGEVSPTVPADMRKILGEKAATGEHDFRLSFLDYMELWAEGCLKQSPSDPRSVF